MYRKQIYVAFITLVILYGEANGKKSKTNKYPPTKDDETSPQPNVVAYSTFGFNDVGSYDGFVPSSPDYSSFLSGGQESTTRLYAPAFPTASDVTGLETNYGSQPFDGQTFSGNDDEQSSMVQYPQSTMNFFSTPSLDSDDYNQNKGSEESYRPNTDDSNAPVYGTKLNLRTKNNIVNQLINNSEVNGYANSYSSLNDDNYYNYADMQATHESTPKRHEPNHNYHKIQNHVPSFSTTRFENAVKSVSSNTQNNFKFPAVVDFTHMKTIYPTALDNIATTTPKPTNPYIFTDLQTESTYEKPYSEYNKFLKVTSAFDNNSNKDTADRNVLKPNSYHDNGSSYSFTSSHSKNTAPNTRPSSEYKKKIKNKPWSSFQNYTNDFKNWKDVSALKGYEYKTNNSKMTFKYEFGEHKKPFSSNVDEIVPASSNLDNYQFPENDYSKFKKIPKVTEDDDFTNFGFINDAKPKTKDYSNLYKDLFSTVPSTTSYWGNAFKSSDYSFSKNQPQKSPYIDDINEDVVTIPKRPHKPNFSKTAENKPSEWSFGSSRPYKSSKPQKDWNKEVNNRFKSEEDLLGLRNHDTSHPSYLPTYKPTYENTLQDENYRDYRNLIEKWRQSYLKSKLKDSFRDYEAFATENKPQHVPVPKPYPVVLKRFAETASIRSDINLQIEVPHPVIVPVPQPYPVRVPVSKPVAVPVIHELTVPIEKPVPYPVFKKVPYPVEKPVPVPVEKEVAVPVIKPYPVPIPYVRPVFHHTRHPHDDFDSDQRNHFDDGDYMPRPEGSNRKPQHKRRPYSSRNRSRRPSRNTYQERSRRRWPEHRRPNAPGDNRSKYPRPEEFHQPHYRHHDDSEAAEDDRSDRYSYCKRNGQC